jgi:hypothetical protein
MAVALCPSLERATLGHSWPASEFVTKWLEMHWLIRNGSLYVGIGKTPLPGNILKGLAVSWKRHNVP